jgi:H+/Cl- antiporter ClcA
LTSTTPISESSSLINDATQPRELNYAQTMFCAALIGIMGGLVATVYYYGIEACLHFVWHTLPLWVTPFLPTGTTFSNYLWAVTTIGGFCVGLTLHLMGLPGEVAMVVDKVHDPGRIEIKQTPAMIVASLFSITAGGSAGPEAPLVQIIGSFGSWLGLKLKLQLVDLRVLTFCGMSAALGAFFGAPLGGALFALEIPHRRGLEYYEALVPAVLSAILSFFVFCLNTGLTIGGMYHFPAVTALTMTDLYLGALLGAVGAATALLFVLIFRVVGYFCHFIEHHTIALATLGGLSIGLIAMVFPQTLFFGEQEIQTVFDTGATLGVTMLLAIGVAKMLAISCTLHSGFRGGFIFPLFYVGAAIGLAISLGFPQIHPTIAMVCMMAAVNVAITKTPISTAVILSVLSDSAIVPVIIIASLVSFLLTTELSLIKTQRSRTIKAD